MGQLQALESTMAGVERDVHQRAELVVVSVSLPDHPKGRLVAATRGGGPEKVRGPFGR